MEKASKVMYKIANVFNWILLVCGIVLMVIGILALVNPSMFQNSEGDIATAGGTLLGVGIYFVIWCGVLIALTRMAYKKGTSKGWDILFLIVGIVACDIFYSLGGLFGLIAKSN